MKRRVIRVAAIALVSSAVAFGCASAETEDPPASGTGGQTGGSSGSAGSGGSGVGGGVFAGGSAGLGGSGASGGSGGAPAIGGATSAGGSSAGGGSGGSLPTNTLLFEDFEDNEATNWIADVAGDDSVGNWAVVMDGAGHVYRQQTEYSDESWSVGGDLAWTDQRVETKVRFSSSAGEGVALLAARLQSKRSFYFLEFEQHESDGSLRLRKRVDGSSTEVIPRVDVGMPIVDDTWYTIALAAKGSTLSIYFNGTMLGMATDSSLANGGVAVGIVDAVADFDDVTVTLP